MQRTFSFEHENDDDAKLVEASEPLEKSAGDEHVKHD